MSNNIGWLKLHRQLLNWKHKNNPEILSVWIHLLLNAAYEDETPSEFNISLNKGQVAITLKTLSEATGISIKKTRRAIKTLEMGKQIRAKGANKYTLITLIEWEIYQGVNEKRANRLGQKGQTKPQKRANSLYNKDKEYKEEKYIYKNNFNKFWVEYGKIGNKTEAYEIWLELSEKEQLRILNNISKFFDCKKEKGSFLIKAENWLADGIWKKDIDIFPEIINVPEPQEASNDNWRIVRIKLAETLGIASFNSWLAKHIQAVEKENTATIILCDSNRFVKEYIERHYVNMILILWKEINQNINQIVIKTSP